MRRVFFEDEVVAIANKLLGMRLVSTIDGKKRTGFIVETEAYLPVGDSACHAARGMTRSNRSMFGPPGRAYVYPIHSRHCFNVVTGSDDSPSAILIRAVQPDEGIAEMQRQRGIRELGRLTSGPGCLCQAFGIDRRQDGINLLTRRQLWIDDDIKLHFDRDQIKVTPRIGVTSAADLPLRFVVAGNEFVSGPRKWR